MKITTLVLQALGLAGFAAAQNGNDPLILNNRTALDPIVYDTFSTSYTDAPAVKSAVSVPVTPSLVRSNTFIKPITSIECWRNGYPYGHNGSRRSRRLVADLFVPTPALDASVPPPEFLSTRTDVPLPGETDVPVETGGLTYDILSIPASFDGTPLPTNPTGDASMGTLPTPTSLGGEPQYDAPTQAPISETIFSVLPIITSSPGAEMSPIPTSWWRGSKSSVSWQSKWPGLTSDGALAPSQTVGCHLHFCPTGSLNSTSTPPSTPLPTVPGSVDPPTITPGPSTSSHFAIPPRPGETVVDTYSESATSRTSTPPSTSPPTNTESTASIDAPAVTPVPSATSRMPVPDGMHSGLFYCGLEFCVTIDTSGNPCFSSPTLRSGSAVPPETTTSAGIAASELIMVTIAYSRHYCTSGMATIYTITPTPYTYPIIPATSDFAAPPVPTHVAKAFVPIDWWRGPGQPVLPDAPEGLHGPIQRHSSMASTSSLSPNDPCFRHYCPLGHTPAKPLPTTMLTATKPFEPVVSVSLHFPDTPPVVSTPTI
ncbi:hypothetical protein N0V86_005669 [Didymella sp. IMI 355093]|nr:hypothetical protein N0V86_005669 [Didymella sp. IMI 355093]